MSQERPFTGLEGTVIAGCTLLEELGRGGSGVVYLARQPGAALPIACKLLLPHCAADPQEKEAFFREAQTAAEFSHENIIRAIAAGEEGEYSYFFMEYVDGETLESFRKNHPSVITFRFLLNLGVQLASVLEYIWESKAMIHGDIKPENLMIRYADHALKLTDLGETGRPDCGIDQSGVTPLYAPPEVILGGSPEKSIQSDMYSCGIMLYELASGKAPFEGSMEVLFSRHLQENIPPLSRLLPDIDPDFSRLIETMVAKEPDERPRNWREIREKLEAIRKRHLSLPPGEKKKHSFRPLSLLIGALLFFLLLAAAFRWFFSLLRHGA